jgi:hypothetical protein
VLGRSLTRGRATCSEVRPKVSAQRRLTSDRRLDVLGRRCKRNLKALWILDQRDQIRAGEFAGELTTLAWRMCESSSVNGMKSTQVAPAGRARVDPRWTTKCSSTESASTPRSSRLKALAAEAAAEGRPASRRGVGRRVRFGWATTARWRSRRRSYVRGLGGAGRSLLFRSRSTS